MTRDITVNELRKELDDLQDKISVYLNNKLSDFFKSTGVAVTSIDLDVIKLTGGFPKKTIESVVTNLRLGTNLDQPYRKEK